VNYTKQIYEPNWMFREMISPARNLPRRTRNHRYWWSSCSRYHALKRSHRIDKCLLSQRKLKFEWNLRIGMLTFPWMTVHLPEYCPWQILVYVIHVIDGYMRICLLVSYKRKKYECIFSGTALWNVFVQSNIFSKTSNDSR